MKFNLQTTFKGAIIYFFTLAPLSLLCQENNTFIRRVIERDSMYIMRLLNHANDMNMDSLIKIGEEFNSNIHKVPGPLIELLTNTVIGNINLKGDQVSYAGYNSKELYAFLIYRKIQEENGTFNYDAGNKYYSQIIIDHHKTLNIVKKYKIDDYALRSLFVLSEILQTRGRPIDRWYIFLKADSIYNYNPNNFNQSTQKYHHNLYNFYCNIGQFNCDKQYDFGEDNIQNIYSFDSISRPNLLGENYLDIFFILNEDPFKIPSFEELNSYIDDLVYTSLIGNFSPEKKLSIAIEILNRVDSAQSIYADFLVTTFETSREQLNGLKIESRKERKDFKAALKVLRDKKIVYEIAEESFKVYKSKLLFLILRDYLIEGIYTLNMRDYDLNSQNYLTPIDSLHNVLLASLDTQINPMLTTYFVDMLIDMDTVKSYNASHIIRLGIAKEDVNIVKYLKRAITWINEEQSIINIYSYKNIETLYLKNIDNVYLSIFKGLMSKVEYSDLYVLHFENDFENNVVHVLALMTDLKNELLGKNIDLYNNHEYEFMNLCLFLNDEFQNVYSAFFSKDSMIVRHIVFPKEIIDYERQTIADMIYDMNKNFISGDYQSYIYFANSILYYMPYLVFDEGNKFILTNGVLNYVNWSIIEDVLRYLSKMDIHLYKTSSFWKKDFLDLKDEMKIVAISNLDYNLGTDNVGNISFGQFRGKRIGKYWSNLPGTLKETEMITKYYSDQLTSYNEITKSDINRSLRDADIVHIASHADYNPLMQGHNSAFIVLDSANYFESSFDSINPQAYYTIGDIRLNRYVNTSLVVLSACNSGFGKSLSNTFATSMPSVLLANGSKSVLASFWEIDDTKASMYFDIFYSELKRSNNIFEAYNSTKRQFREHGDDPTLTYSFELIVR